METYDSLLTEAYKNVRPTEICGRFEIKKVEGHIEGNKTIISNFGPIVNCTRRKPEHIAKFIFKELATSGEISGERLILTRKITSQQITEKLRQYYDCFVLCQNCKKPDTELIEENGHVFLKCMACGAKRAVICKI